VSVNGTNVAGMSNCLSVIGGPVGTSVTLELADPQRHQTNTFTIKRANVAEPDDLDDLFRDIFGPGSGTNAPFLPKPILISH
jgi:hypothetical protein